MLQDDVSMASQSQQERNVKKVPVPGQQQIQLAKEPKVILPYSRIRALSTAISIMKTLVQKSTAGLPQHRLMIGIHKSFTADKDQAQRQIAKLK